MGAGTAVAQRERSPRRTGPQPRPAQTGATPEQPAALPGVPQFLDAHDAGSDDAQEAAPGPDAGDTQASHQVDSELARSGAALEAGTQSRTEEPEEETPQTSDETEAPTVPPHHAPQPTAERAAAAAKA